MVPQILALLRQQMVFNTVIASCVRLPASSSNVSKDGDEIRSSTHHVFEIQALNLFRLAISFEVKEDNDLNGHEEDDELMRQLDEETTQGDAGGLVSVEVNLKEMGQATCVLKGGVDPALLPSNEFATRIMNKTLSIPVTMRAIVKRCLDLQRERKQKVSSRITIRLSVWEVTILLKPPNLHNLLVAASLGFSARKRTATNRATPNQVCINS
jgi:hypothetical protein